MKFFKFFLLFLLSFATLFGNYEASTEQFNRAKIDYLKAVVNGNTEEEIKNLNTIINLGKELKIDTSRYESTLKSIYDKTSNKSVIQTPTPPKKPEQPSQTQIKQQNNQFISNQKQQSNTQSNDSKYSITSIETNGNDIIIRFNTDITLDDIKFSQERGKTHKDIFDINGSFKDANSTTLQIDGVDRVITNQQTPKILRISILNSSNPNTIYMVNPRSIILRTFPKVQTSQQPKQAQKTIEQTTFLRSRTIVIDPGHGGKDPGAVVGSNHEKTAVLEVGKHLRDFLIQRGYNVYMTRDKDIFLELKQRTDFANSKNADLFISIHANAVELKNAANAKGVETYFLSPARSERAKRLAALENKDQLQDLTDSGQNALLTILNRHRITASNKLAIDIQRYMLHEVRKIYKDTTDGGVREGPFYVLLGAQMPSVLVEIGYMSHASEGKRIFEANYQKHVAKGIANGIDSYFLNNP